MTTTIASWQIPILDGFHEMSESERSALHFAAEGEGVCLSDPKRHILISVGAQTINAFSALLLSTSDLAKNAEKQIARLMQSNGYRREQFVTRKIDGLHAEGYRYTYTAQSVGMTGETYVVKDGKTVIYFHVYVREAHKDEGFAIWNAFLDGMHKS